MGNEKYTALQAEDGLWGVEDEQGAILYEADIASEAEAQFIAKYHTNHPEAEFERDVWPAWVDHLASTDPYESALLFVETAPQDDLISLVIEYRKLKAENEKLRTTLDEIVVIANDAQEFGRLPNRKLLAIVQIGFKAASTLGYKVANVIDDFHRTVFTFEKS
jgi:hypothetical protein